MERTGLPSSNMFRTPCVSTAAAYDHHRIGLLCLNRAADNLRQLALSNPIVDIQAPAPFHPPADGGRDIHASISAFIRDLTTAATSDPAMRIADQAFKVNFRKALVDYRGLLEADLSPRSHTAETSADADVLSALNMAIVRFDEAVMRASDSSGTIWINAERARGHKRYRQLEQLLNTPPRSTGSQFLHAGATGDRDALQVGNPLPLADADKAEYLALLDDWVQDGTASEDRAQAASAIQNWLERGDQDEPLDLAVLGLSSLPDKLPAVKMIYASHNHLTSLPQHLPETLEIVDVGSNRLSSLPEKLPAALAELDLSNNQFRVVPPVIDSLGRECSVDLQDNPLKLGVRHELWKILKADRYAGPTVLFAAPTREEIDSLSWFQLDFEDDGK